MERTALMAEALAQQERWAALMMGVHARLGAESLLARVPPEVCAIACVDALGVELEVSVHNRRGSVEKMAVYSALKEFPLIKLLEQPFLRADLRLSHFKLKVEFRRRYHTRPRTQSGSSWRPTTLKRFRTLAEQSSIMDERAEVTARCCSSSSDDNTINVTVRRQDAALVFRTWPHAPLQKMLLALCARQQLDSSHVSLAFKGQRVWEHWETPECLDIKDGDEAVVVDN